MSSSLRPNNDPRSVARDIPGIFDVLFPQLTSGVVAHLNRQAYRSDACEAVPSEAIDASTLQKAMLFELAVAAAEQLLGGLSSIDWKACLQVAIAKQRHHFDAKLPAALDEVDIAAATRAANNLVAMLSEMQRRIGRPLLSSPHIPGYQWIASGSGDFSIGEHLIEVKCSHKNFSSSDYRQVVMYWLLSYAAAVERGTTEWVSVILVNPRLNFIFASSFDDLVRVIAAGRSKVEILELFAAMVSDQTFRLLAPI